MTSEQPGSSKMPVGTTSSAVKQTIDSFPATQPIGFQFNPTRLATKDDGVSPAAKVTPAQQALPPVPAEGGIQPAFASGTVAGAPSIVELARALKNDGQLIYQFVHDNCEWEPGWGVQKGALGALQDGLGNQFDQSLLLANLLRQAGLTANIVQGTIRLTEAQCQAWWKVNDIWGAQSYCLNEYIPIVTVPTWNGTTYYMDIKHVWVQWVSPSTYIQRFDSETGLYYYKRRYFSTIIGRFLQPDPIGYAADGLNLYAYVKMIRLTTSIHGD